MRNERYGFVFLSRQVPYSLEAAQNLIEFGVSADEVLAVSNGIISDSFENSAASSSSSYLLDHLLYTFVWEDFLRFILLSFRFFH